MNSGSSIIAGSVLLAVGFWLVLSGRIREAVLGVLCMISGAFFIVTALVGIVWRFE